MTYQSPDPLQFTAKRLQGRVIFVTGASSGIGEAAVRLFALEGARVVAAARRTDRSTNLAESRRSEGLEVTAVGCAVRSEESISEALQHVRSTYGRLDGAFNNAGVGGAPAPVHLGDTDAFDQIMATNLRGVFLCLKHEIALMLESGGGSIVNTSSVGGLVGGTNIAIYAASKWGLAGLTKCVALDYARQGIRVNAIAPGPTRSEMFDRRVPSDEARAALADSVPMNYIAHPDDMARAALFLLSDESRWTTGVILPCEGGASVG